MRHNADNDDGGSLYDVEGKGKEVLANIIPQKEQRAFLQEDNTKRIEESAERQFLEHKRVQIHLRGEVRNSPRVEVTLFKCLPGYDTRQTGGGNRENETN